MGIVPSYISIVYEYHIFYRTVYEYRTFLWEDHVFVEEDHTFLYECHTFLYGYHSCYSSVQCALLHRLQWCLNQLIRSGADFTS